MTIFRWIFAAIVLGLVAVATVASTRPRPMPPLQVQLAKVEKASITRTVSAAGKLEPLRKVNVSSNITGTLLDLRVGIGSEVKKGQYLGQIDTTRYRAQVAQQVAQAEAASSDVLREQANLSRLRSEQGRVEKLAAQSIANVGELEGARSAVEVGAAQLDSTKSRAAVARAVLDEARNSLSWATLRAPTDGTVLAVNHRVGERIRGSDFSEDVVLVLGSLAEMDVRIEVGEHDVVSIQLGQKAQIEIDALPDATVEGEVIDRGRDAIVRNAGTDAEVTTYPIWVSLDSPPPGAMSGMSAQVTITTETRPDAIVVPIQAITMRPIDEGAKKEADAPKGPAAPRAKLEKVAFVVTNGKSERRKVVTGISSNTSIEVLSGLSVGDTVVEGPYRVLARELKDGVAVTEKEGDRTASRAHGKAP